MSMTVEEIIKERERMELHLYEILNEFQSRIGIVVSGVNVDIQENPVPWKNPSKFIHHVTIELEI